MPCNQKCIQWKAKKPSGGKRYESGQIRCDTCQIFMYPTLEHTHNAKTKKPDDKLEHGLACNCCRMRISGRSYSARYSKYHNSKISIYFNYFFNCHSHKKRNQNSLEWMAILP